MLNTGLKKKNPPLALPQLHSPVHDFCASKVVSLILPSMEAVRQVPQSIAVHQSTVTTGALCPPKERQFSRTFSLLLN